MQITPTTTIALGLQRRAFTFTIRDVAAFSNRAELIGSLTVICVRAITTMRAAEFVTARIGRPPVDEALCLIIGDECRHCDLRPYLDDENADRVIVDRVIGQLLADLIPSDVVIS